MVQTFLRCRSFETYDKYLDYQRLGKQRIEELQILYCINHDFASQNHYTA